MKEIQTVIKLILKSLLFSSLPLLLFLFVLYEIIFEVDADFPWLRLSLYLLLIGVVSINHYRKKEVDEPVEGMEDLAGKIPEESWKVIRRGESSFDLQPRFDFPYNILSRDRVHVSYSDGMALIEGPRLYVETLQKDMQGKKRFGAKRWVRVATATLFLLIFSLPILAEAGVIDRLKVDYHNYRAKSVEKIEIHDSNAMGNIVNNINNYGYGAEYEGHIFYVEDHLNLVRTTRDFQNKTYLIQESSGSGINRLNIVEGWIFYNSGKKLSRMRTDGTGHEVIYGLEYLTDIHVLGNWIYFISHSVKPAVYRMDVNGENLEKIVDREVTDLSIHDNRLFYSYGEGEEGFLESSNLEGHDRINEMGIEVNDFVRWEGYDYFIGHEDYKLYRIKTGAMETPQVLVDDKVSSYFVTEYGIYFTQHSQDAGYPGAGLYKVRLDGTGVKLIEDARNVQSLSHVGDWIFFESWDDTNNLVFERLDIQTDEIKVLE